MHTKSPRLGKELSLGSEWEGVWEQGARISIGRRSGQEQGMMWGTECGARRQWLRLYGRNFDLQYPLMTFPSLSLTFRPAHYWMPGSHMSMPVVKCIRSMTPSSPEPWNVLPTAPALHVTQEDRVKTNSYREKPSEALSQDPENCLLFVTLYLHFPQSVLCHQADHDSDIYRQIRQSECLYT